MASIIRADTLQNLNTSNIITQTNATTLTIGASGQTAAIPSGASLAVDTIKNTNLTTLITQTNSTTITIGATGQTVALPSNSISYAAISNAVDFRNIVINGDMQIAQRNTSVASITTTGYYTLDRWNTAFTSLGTWTMSQSTDVPTGQGFANSLKLDCTTADASPAASDLFVFRQLFEGQNLQYLKKGTANAVPLTASFWVKSTKTGTFILELLDSDNSRQISKSYTVSASNTWEFKTITFPGDTTGTLNNDNGESLRLDFWLGAGSDFSSGTLNTSWASITQANRAVGQVNIADSTANDWLITGVQLEAGEQASGFEFMPYDVNLNRCLRYFEINSYQVGSQDFLTCASPQNNNGIGIYYFKERKRAAPTTAISALSDFTCFGNNYASNTPTAMNFVSTVDYCAVNPTIGAGNFLAQGAYIIRMTGSSGFMSFSSEL